VHLRSCRSRRGGASGGARQQDGSPGGTIGNEDHTTEAVPSRGVTTLKNPCS
jgi:hypothetical protein